MSSLLTFRTSTETAPPTRISLIDNTTRESPRASHDGSGSGHVGLSSVLNRRESGVGKRQVLRKAIAERHYKRWPAEASSTEGSVISRPGTPNNTITTAAASSGTARGRKHDTPVEAAIDVLYENQRGCFLCGLPLFSSKSLLNFDPSPWQNRLYHDSAVSIVNAQPPDPSWVWDWKSWYVDMTGDVDEEGWAYSFSFSPAFSWHGEHVWFNSFVRRRRWLRKRIKALIGDDGVHGSSRSQSRDPAHGLNNDYFTIHSKRLSKHPIDQEEDDEYDSSAIEKIRVTDIPTLLKAFKRARLDREKVEVVLRFLHDGGEELVYLAQRIPGLMAALVFQASRRHLLRALLEYTDAFETGRAMGEEFGILLPNPPRDASSTEPSSEGTSGRTTPARMEKVDETQRYPARQQMDDDARERKLKSLKAAVEAADAEVRKMEYWSDLKGAVIQGESVSAEVEASGWDDTGISGPAVTKAKGKEVDRETEESRKKMEKQVREEIRGEE